jgi:hypothetical protein
MMVIPLTIAAFAIMKPTRAVLLVTFAALLFLPELAAFDAPLIPPLDKRSLSALCLLIGVRLSQRGQPRPQGSGKVFDLLIALALIGAAGTVLTNRDPLQYGPTTLPGMTTGDILADGVRMILFLAYFMLGRRLFRTADDARDLLRALVIAGLVYVPFMLIELRLSPQMHVWIYGYHQHSFLLSRRDDGFRPMVFMENGLTVAVVFAACTMAAWTLTKARLKLWRFPALPLAALMTAMLASIHSLGALIYCVVLAPLLWFFRPKAQLLFGVILCCGVALYPLSRTFDLFPTKDLVDLAARVSQERALSLGFRFRNEDMLLEKALERPVFGWGGFARGRVFDENGNDVSVTDGDWIIAVGSRGILGFVSRFGLLLLPVLMALRRIRYVPAREQGLLSGLGLICTLNAIDLLPNGMGSIMPMFLAGSLAGLAFGMSENPNRRLGPQQLLARYLQLVRRMRSAASPS